jgi:hypothetical protein
MVQHVQDGGEPGVEYAVTGENHNLHGGNHIDDVVPPLMWSLLGR